MTMLIKLGSNISEVSGSIAGHTFQKSSGGVQVRNKPVPLHNPSQSQLMIRSINKQLQQGWKELTDFQRTEWNVYAWTFGIKNRFGDRHVLSGHSLWMKYNFGYLYDHLPLINSPFSYKEVRLGPELIINGEFNGQAPWLLEGFASIGQGFVNKLAGGNGNFRQPFVSVPGTFYQLSFELFVTVYPCQIQFRAFGETRFFSPPYNGNVSFSQGFCFFNSICPVTSQYLMFIMLGVNTIFKLTNISLKQIL